MSADVAKTCGADRIRAGRGESAPLARPNDLLVFSGVGRFDRDRRIFDVDDFFFLGRAGCHKGNEAQRQEDLGARHF